MELLALTPPTSPNTKSPAATALFSNSCAHVSFRQLAVVPRSPEAFVKAYKLGDVLGSGAWCTVSRASLAHHTSRDILPITPPATPEKTCRPCEFPVTFFACKRPARKDGMGIIEKEARILTYLASQPLATEHMVHFYGFDNLTNSILMELLPKTLDLHVRQASSQALSTATMFDPIIGPMAWCELASSLIGGLAFLKKHRCVHGDIKPANILLRSRTDKHALNVENQGAIDSFTWVPIICDFSSSHVLSAHDRLSAETNSCDGIDTTTLSANENFEVDSPAARCLIPQVSAVTVDYTAPELLESLSKSNTRSSDAYANNIATHASDVFALAVTLLFASTGQSPYDDARTHYQRSAMAKEGRPAQYAQSGQQGTRVMKRRAVHWCLKQALAPSADARPSATDWRSEVDLITQNWSGREWKSGGVDCAPSN